MKRLIVLGLAGLLSVPAFSCPLTDWLTQRYGVSAGGFEHDIPQSPAPVIDPATAVRIVFRDTPLVADGFHHAVVLDVASSKAWILRTGGFVGVYRWYGPIDVPALSTATCRIEVPMKTVAHEKGDQRPPST
jgi:hypothetical protein